MTKEKLITVKKDKLFGNTYSIGDYTIDQYPKRDRNSQSANYAVSKNGEFIAKTRTLRGAVNVVSTKGKLRSIS